MKILLWVQNNILLIFTAVLTFVLIVYYWLEKRKSLGLSKKFRGDIYEVQSKIFLTTIRYLLANRKKEALDEMKRALELSPDSLDINLLCGNLLRQQGEVEKAINLHRSLIARKSITENTKIKALTELAIDYDKGGFFERAIATYQDVLAINPDQKSAMQALCRLYENVQDWEKAYDFRFVLSKTGEYDFSKTLSHLLTEWARSLLQRNEKEQALSKLDEGLKHAPTISAKLLLLQIHLDAGNSEEAFRFFLEIVKEKPFYAPIVIDLLQTPIMKTESESYREKLVLLLTSFVQTQGNIIEESLPIVLAKFRTLVILEKFPEAISYIVPFMNKDKNLMFLQEIIPVLSQQEDQEDILRKFTKLYFEIERQKTTKNFCQNCGYSSDNVFWRCPQCFEWETISVRWAK